MTAQPATVLDYLSRAHDARVIVSELDEVIAAADKFAEQVQRSYDAALDRHGAHRPSEVEREWARIEAELAAYRSQLEPGGLKP